MMVLQSWCSCFPNARAGLRHELLLYLSYVQIFEIAVCHEPLLALEVNFLVNIHCDLVKKIYFNRTRPNRRANISENSVLDIWRLKMSHNSKHLYNFYMIFLYNHFEYLRLGIYNKCTLEQCFLLLNSCFSSYVFFFISQLML